VIALLLILAAVLALLVGPWLVMITIGIAFHNWGWPPAPLSFVESIPFALFLAVFVASGNGSRR
jgi:hypothetical protein